MAVQDFQANYTEVDAGGDIVVSTTEIAVTSMSRAVTSYVYKDFGVDYFSGSTQVRMKVHIPSGSDVGSGVNIATFTNALNDLKTIDDASGDFLTIWITNVAGTLTLYVGECVSGASVVDGGLDISGLDDTDLWLIIERDETYGTYGAVYVYGYESTEYTSRSIYAGLALTQKTDFRYFMPIVSYNNGDAGEMDITIDECYVGNADAISFTKNTMKDMGTMANEYLVDNKKCFCKTSSGRWYGHVKWHPSAYNSGWIYSDSPKSGTWEGPFIVGSGGWLPYGHTLVASGSRNFDDVIGMFDYKENTSFSQFAVQGKGYTGAFDPGGTIDNAFTTSAACNFFDILNVEQTDETFVIYPRVESTNYGYSIAYTDAGGVSGWTDTGFVQVSSSNGNPLYSAGGIKSVVTKDGLWIYLIYRDYLGSVNYEGLSILRYDVTNHTSGTPQIIAGDHAEYFSRHLQMTVDLDGYIHILAGDGESSAKVLYYRLSDDGDDSFTLEAGPIIAMERPSGDIDMTGLAVNQLGHIFFGCNLHTYANSWMRASYDNGETWHNVWDEIATNVCIQGPYQDPNRAHTYLTSGCPPFVHLLESTDTLSFVSDDAEGDYLEQFPDWTEDDLDGGDWGRRIALTIDKTYIGEDLTHFPLILSKKVLPGEMFLSGGSYAAREDGGDIRVSLDENGDIRLPVDVREFHIAADTGDAYANICVGMTGECLTTGEDTTIYVWYNNPGATLPQAGETYGNKNVYDDNFVGVFPLCETPDNSYDFPDRTRNGYMLEGIALDATNRVTGEISHAITTNGTDEAIESHLFGSYANGWITFAYPFTYSLIAQRDPAGAGTYSRVSPSRDDSWDHFWTLHILTDGTGSITIDAGASPATATTSNTIGLGENGWLTGIGENNTSRYAQLNASARVQETSTEAHPTSDPVDNFFHLGRMIRSGDTWTAGKFEELRISSSVRSQHWTNAEYYNIFEPLNFFSIGTPDDPGPVGPVSELRRHQILIMS